MIPTNIIKQIIACLGMEQGEKFTVIGDSTTKEIVESIRKEMQKQGQEIDHFDLDVYRRPLADVPEELAEAARNSTLVFYAIDKVGDELAFRKALNKAAEDEGIGGRVGNMLSMTEEAILSGFNCDMNEVKELTCRLKDYMEKVSVVHLQTPEGTSIVVEFDHPRYKWVTSTGFIERKKARNVMPAEVYTHPVTADGIVYITGMYQHLTTIDEFKKDLKRTAKRLKINPIYMRVKNGRVVDVKCQDAEIEQIAKQKVFEGGENSDRLGEYGMGTNIGIKECNGIFMHDEKYPGVHLAHGHGYGKTTGCEYDSPVHIDGVILNSTVRDLKTDKLVLDNGRYLI